MRGEDERGDELNAAANLSVWKGIMPALNIAARLGRQKEREKKDSVSHASQYSQDAFTPKSAFFQQLCTRQKPPNERHRLSEY